MKYRTKPVVIEAIQWNGLNLEQIRAFTNNEIDSYQYDFSENLKYTELFIHTREGDLKAFINDYIVKGIHGDFYPCHPEVFLKRYEPVL